MNERERENVCMCIFVCAFSCIFMRICAIVWAYARCVYMCERRIGEKMESRRNEEKARE